MSEHDHRQKLLEILELRLSILEEQLAYQGITSAPPQLIMEAEDTRRQIAELKAEIKPDVDNKPQTQTIPVPRPNSQEFDVFLCHNSKDKPAVKDIARQLLSLGLRPWLDEWELRPGIPWQRELEKQIGKIKAQTQHSCNNGQGIHLF